MVLEGVVRTEPMLVALVSMGRIGLRADVPVVVVVDVLVVVAVVLLAVATLEKAGDPLTELDRFAVVVLLVDSVSVVAHLMMEKKSAPTVHWCMFE